MSYLNHTQNKRLLMSALLTVLCFPLTAAPLTPGTTIQPTSQATVVPARPDCPEHELELPHEKLQTLCKHILAHENLHFDYSMRKAAATLLERFFAKHPTEHIERCVVLTPEGRNVDEEIATYQDKTHTLFLLLGKGIKTPVDPLQPESCADVKPETAGSGKTAILPVPASWHDSFTIKHSIVLQPGQKLLGVPIDISNSELADGYYVSLRRQVTAGAICASRGYWRTYKGININRNSFITLKGKGIFVSGITNAHGIDESIAVHNTCRYYGRHKVRDVNARDAHQHIIRAEIAPASLHTTTHSAMVDISNNELLQIHQPAISVALKKPESKVAAILSGWIFDKTFVHADGNRIYSCIPTAGELPPEPAFVADFTYWDYAQEPEKIHTMDLKHNLFIAGKNSAVNIKLSANSDATLSGNNLLTAGDSLYGVILTGGKEEAKSEHTFYLKNNMISGFRTALLLNSSLSLVLKSNDLLGTQRAIERGEWQIDTLTLSGDGNNTYKKGIQSLCQNLSSESVTGKIIFRDGTTCPQSDDTSTTASPDHE